MNARRDLKNLKENIEKSNNEYGDIVLKIKLAKADLLKTNSELQQKAEENVESKERS